MRSMQTTMIMPNSRREQQSYDGSQTQRCSMPWDVGEFLEQGEIVGDGSQSLLLFVGLFANLADVSVIERNNTTPTQPFACPAFQIGLAGRPSALSSIAPGVPSE